MLYSSDRVRAGRVPLASVADSYLGKNVIMPSFEVIDVVQEQVAALERQQGQSLLAKAFRSKFVPQDPNDKPASILLESIRAEREANGVWAKSGSRRARRRRWAKSRTNVD